eukprot:5545893-Pyramimonas_sp.AAC.1
MAWCLSSPAPLKFGARSDASASVDKNRLSKSVAHLRFAPYVEHIIDTLESAPVEISDVAERAGPFLSMLNAILPWGAIEATRGANPRPSCAKTNFSAPGGSTVRFHRLIRGPTA